jgi:hypothetical protein
MVLGRQHLHAGPVYPRLEVNFCKFTNETRNGLEDSSKHDGLKGIAAVTGACAGGDYELALPCDRIIMVDDRSSTVSLPEVPLLGVLPGTGGLTRVTDKRKVRQAAAVQRPYWHSTDAFERQNCCQRLPLRDGRCAGGPRQAHCHHHGACAQGGD